LFKSPYFQHSTNEILRLLNAIFDTSHDGIYVCDKYGRTLIFNDAFLKISGIPENLLYKFSVFELLEMNVVPNSCAAVTIKTKKKHNTIIAYYNGKKAILTSTPIFDENNEIECVVSNVRDITELNSLQMELEKTREITTIYQEALQQLQKEIQSNEILVYRSKVMENIVSMALRFAKNDAPILLLGESGVGKDVLAQFIHNKSGRRGSFVRINCGAIPEHLLESEFFGFEKGAFTGAEKAKPGLFEIAHDGTIFLDEIGDLPYPLQVKLLNVLQEQKIRRIGGVSDRKVNIRVIAATNADLQLLIEQKKFRKDLYYRLNVLSITIPPLRERIEDIPVLAIYFLNKLLKKYKIKKMIEVSAMDRLMSYDWPGNIRELKNLIERVYYMTESDKITADDLPESIRTVDSINVKEPTLYVNKLPLKEAMNQFEKYYIKETMNQSKTLKECAEKLNIDISTLIRKKKKLRI
jgi:PAS domain S-box-containing protein